MKESFTILLVAWVLSLQPTPCFGAQKIGVVEMQRLFENYYKAKQLNDQLREAALKMDRGMRELRIELAEANAEAERLKQQAADRAVSVLELGKRKADYELQRKKVREIEARINAFDKNARVSLQNRQEASRQRLIEEITKVVEEVADQHDYDFVFDTSAQTLNRTPFIVFGKKAHDLTQTVTEKLNVGASKHAPTGE